MKNIKRPIIIDCNKQRDGYCIRVNPASMKYLKIDVYRPSMVSLGFDNDAPKLSLLQWKIFCKGLLNFKKMVPCRIKQVGKGTVYFRWPLKDKR